MLANDQLVRKAPRYSKPRRWKSIARIGVIPILALTLIAGLFYAEHSFQREKQTGWMTVTATIEDTRNRPVAHHALEYGGATLYEIDVLADYRLNSSPQKEWIPLSEPPKTLDETHAQQLALKGKQCFVRWNPSTPDQKLAELN